MPDHTGDGFGVLPDIIENQTVETGMKLLVEFQFDNRKQDNYGAGAATPEERQFVTDRTVGETLNHYRYQNDGSDNDHVETGADNKGAGNIFYRD